MDPGLDFYDSNLDSGVLNLPHNERHRYRKYNLHACPKDKLCGEYMTLSMIGVLILYAHLNDNTTLNSESLIV